MAAGGVTIGTSAVATGGELTVSAVSAGTRDGLVSAGFPQQHESGEMLAHPWSVRSQAS